MTSAKINREIENIVASIAREYRPRRVILFGSAAQGNYHPGSDVDLLVIKETAKKPLARVREVVDLLPHTLDVDIIVMTPAEWEARRRENHYLVREIDEKGKVLFDDAHEASSRELA